jgi:hypothetical protein
MKRVKLWGCWNLGMHIMSNNSLLVLFFFAGKKFWVLLSSPASLPCVVRDHRRERRSAGLFDWPSKGFIDFGNKGRKDKIICLKFIDIFYYCPGWGWFFFLFFSFCFRSISYRDSSNSNSYVALQWALVKG